MDADHLFRPLESFLAGCGFASGMSVSMTIVVVCAKLFFTNGDAWMSAVPMLPPTISRPLIYVGLTRNDSIEDHSAMSESELAQAAPESSTAEDAALVQDEDANGGLTSEEVERELRALIGNGNVHTGPTDETELELGDLADLERLLYDMGQRNTASSDPGPSINNGPNEATQQSEASENVNTEPAVPPPSGDERSIKTSICEKLNITEEALDRVVAIIQRRGAAGISYLERQMALEEGRAMLTKIMRARMPEAVVWLLNCHFDLCAKEDDFERILMLGLDHRHDQLVRRALSERLDINMEIENYGTILQRAIVRGSSRYVETLIRHGAEVH